jgi:hypothetical protein
LALTACGSDESDTVISDQQVVANVASANINGLGNVGTGTHRWVATTAATPQINVYVPTPADATQTDLAGKVRTAIAEHNRRLAGLLVLTEVATAPTSGGYMRVSYLTSYVPPGSTNYAGYCGNVATGPSIGNVVNATSPTGEHNQTVAWVNLGNGHCTVTQEIVTHEIGHALGLGSHFDGFGNGDAISRAYWDVVATLYANPVRSAASALVVRRAAN